MTAFHTDQVFAPIDLDHALERLAGGNETEVYRTDDGRNVVKLKGDMGGGPQGALADARAMQAAADQFAACLGPRHSIPATMWSRATAPAAPRCWWSSRSCMARSRSTTSTTRR